MFAVSWRRDIFAQVKARKFRGQTFTSPDASGAAVTIEVKVLDLYVAGFPCSAFSSAGKRDGWESEIAACFKHVLATIKSMLPRAFILENVPNLMSKNNKPKLDRALSWLQPEYDVAIVRTNSDRYDVPQDRERVYIIGLRKDAVRSKDSLSIVQEDIRAVEAAIAEEAPEVSWDVWLEKMGWPLIPADASSTGFVAAQPCPTCGPQRVCPHHVCTCDRCVKGGTLAKKCMWRMHTVEWLKKNSKRIRAYKRGWLKVRQTLKRSPDYYDLAKAKNMHIPSVVQQSPRVRAAVSAWSSAANLFSRKTIVNTSQAVNRASPRNDGKVPALTTTCGKLFAPSAGVFLQPEQCLALQGFDCRVLPVDDFSDAELCTFAGMAMTVPVIGTIMTAVVSQLKAA
jgi:DNA-cytosine methyltransferase